MNEKIFEIQRFAETITLTKKDDNYVNEAEGVIINALAGNDSISNTADNVTVNAADGNDTITNTVYNSVVLNGDEGDDVIISTDDQGDYPGEILMDGGAGNDILKNERKISLSDEGGASYSPEEVYGTLIGGIGDDTIQVNALDNFLDGGEGDDKIYSSGSNNKLNGGAGNDVLSAGTYDYTAVIDEDRSYTKTESDLYSVLDGGEGDDTLSTDGNYNTLSGGEGDDIVSLSSSASNNFVKFSAGDGNDTIFGFNSDNTLQITEGTYETLQSGFDVILKIGEDSVTFKDGALTLLQIQGADGEVETLQIANGVSNSVANTVVSGTSDNDFISNSAVNVTVNAAEGNDTITNRGNNSVLNGGAGADIILSEGSTDSVFDALDNGTIYYISHGVNNSSIYGGKGNDKIEVVGNKNLIDGGEDDDSIVVTTYGVPFEFGEAGAAVEHYASTDNTIKGGKGNDTINLSENYNSFVNGEQTPTNSNTVIQYTEGDGNDIIYGLNNTDTLQITGGSYTTTKSGNDVIVKVGSGLITLSGAADIALNIATVEADKSSLLTYNAKKTAVTLASGFKGTLKSSDYDSTVKIVNASKVSSGIVINGNAQDNKILGSKGKDSINGGKGKDTLSGGDGNDKLFGGSGNDSLVGGKGKDTLSGGDGDDKLFGGSGNDLILGGAGKDNIYGDSGNDTLNGGKGSDTLTGGSGKDVFVYASGGGKDVITDYTAGEDKIKITSGKISKTSYSGKDVIFTIGSGTLKIKNGKGKKITINNSSKIYSGSSALFAENNFVTADNLSSIVENNLSSVSEIQTQNFDSLTQENLITYAE